MISITTFAIAIALSGAMDVTMAITILVAIVSIFVMFMSIIEGSVSSFVPHFHSSF